MPLLVGTDSHGPNALAGLSLVEEVGIWVDAGIPVLDALRATTIGAAR